MSVAEGYAGVMRVLAAEKPEAGLTDDQVIALLDDLSARMAAASREFRTPATFNVKGTNVVGEWPEAK